jgi:hypothetical protein
VFKAMMLEVCELHSRMDLDCTKKHQSEMSSFTAYNMLTSTLRTPTATEIDAHQNFNTEDGIR